MQAQQLAAPVRASCALAGASSLVLAAGYPGDKQAGTLWQSQCDSVPLTYSGEGPFTSVAQCSSGGCSNIISHDLPELRRAERERHVGLHPPHPRHPDWQGTALPTGRHRWSTAAALHRQAWPAVGSAGG